MWSADELLSYAGDYRNHRLVKYLWRYDDDIGNQPKEMTKKTAIKIKNGTFNGKGLLLVIVSLREIKVA